MLQVFQDNIFPETNSSPLKISGLKDEFPFWGVKRPIFRGEVLLVSGGGTHQTWLLKPRPMDFDALQGF